MFRQPISKYKNASAKIVKKEQILSGISTNRLSNTIGSLVNCNLKHITFAIDSASGGSVCTVRQDDLSRKLTFSNDVFTVTHAHSGPITDIQYNYTTKGNKSILSTCGFDSQIQLWSVDNDASNSESPQVNMNLLTSLNLQENRSDCVQWNPNVENILVSTSQNNTYLWDINNDRPLNMIRNHTESIQSISWKRDGSLIVTTAKDKTMQIIDPRNINKNEHLKIENAKTSNKDSKVVWIGTSDCILSSVYTQSFQREIHLWDIRNTSAPVNEFQIDTGNVVLNPLYDYDTSVLFLVGKAETVVRYCEIFINDVSWNFACNSSQPVDDQIKGVCLLPKFGLDLMKCELDRLILLTRNSVYPLPYFVPRRSYYDFHSDVFPETYNIFEPGINKLEWLEGKNSSAKKTTLNPDTQNRLLNNKPINVEKNLADKTQSSLKASNISTPNVVVSSSDNSHVKDTQPVVLKKPANNSLSSSSSSSSSSSASSGEDKENTQVVNNPNNNKVVFRNQTAATIKSVDNSHENGHSRPADSSTLSVQSNKPANNNTNSVNLTADRKTRIKSVYYQSKYKYINVKAANKNEHITNIRNLSAMWPSECNGFQVNAKHAAYYWGTSGQIGLVELNTPGRLPDTNTSSIVNRSKVSDFQWDPFDDETLACACDDGVVKIWKIPEDGLTEPLMDPIVELKGHTERLYCIAYHPYVKNVIASASYDRTIRLWNIDTAKAAKVLKGHTDSVFSMSWSPCGSKLATICKDGYIRIYDPLASETPIVEDKCGPAPNSKAARIEWVLNGKAILVSGFGRGNLRQIFLFDSSNLSLMQAEDITQSPSLLITHYDPDINVLYLYAKGEETLYLYEIQENEPYFQTLSPFKPDGPHVALAFLPKSHCDVRTAEIAKAYRMTKDRIEKMSFTVPRVKLGYFQDDIYPDTIDRSAPYLTASQWFSGEKLRFKYISLQPADMQRLTEVQSVETPKPVKTNTNTTSKLDIYDPKNLNDDERKIISSMLNRATLFYKEKSDDDDENSDWN